MKAVLFLLLSFSVLLAKADDAADSVFFQFLNVIRNENRVYVPVRYVLSNPPGELSETSQRNFIRGYFKFYNVGNKIAQVRVWDSFSMYNRADIAFPVGCVSTGENSQVEYCVGEKVQSIIESDRGRKAMVIAINPLRKTLVLERSYIENYPREYQLKQILKIQR